MRLGLFSGQTNMKHLSIRLTAMILIICVIGVLGFLAHRFGSMHWLVENETNMREFVETYRWQGWLLGLGIYTAFSMVPGTVGKAVVWGWVFGFWPAVLIVDLGLTTAAIASFLAARFIFRESVSRRFAKIVEKLDRNLEQDAAFYLLMVRVAHVPFSLVNYGAGATAIRLRTFSWTTLVGLLPGTMIFVFVGTRIPTLASLAEKGVWQLLDPLLISLLAATFVFPLVFRWAIKIYRRRTGETPDLKLGELDSYDPAA